MSRPIATLTRIVKNPYLNVVVGLVFLYTGISETVHELDQLEDGTKQLITASSFLPSCMS